VLRKYFDAVNPGAKHPKAKTMGAYLDAMDKAGVGDPKVKAALTEIKNLHRNPLLHPDDIISTADEAMNLLGAVRASIGAMLREIPQPTYTPTGLAGLLTPPSQSNL
jgi:hypothetical protein